jgi:hypothetical protein
MPTKVEVYNTGKNLDYIQKCSDEKKALNGYFFQVMFGADLSNNQD